MVKNVVLICVLFVAVFITGCSSAPTREQAAKDEVRASEIRAKAEEERREQAQKRMEAEISQVPEWALKPPRPDSTGVYAAGMSESDTMRVAIRKAMLEAEFGLAKNFNQELSGSERLYAQENGGRVGTEQYTTLIDKLVGQVPVVGFEVEHQEVKALDGKYIVYVLVKLPYAQLNRVLQEQREKAADRTVAAAFDDLEQRINRRRQQIREDEARQIGQGGADRAGISATAQNLADGNSGAASKPVAGDRK